MGLIHKDNMSNWILATVAVVSVFIMIFSGFYAFGRLAQHLEDLEALEIRTTEKLESLEIRTTEKLEDLQESSHEDFDVVHRDLKELSVQVARIEGYLSVEDDYPVMVWEIHDREVYYR